MSQPADRQPSRQSDLLYGVPAIGRYLRIRERQARHRIEAGTIPTFRMDGTICARESSLDAWLAEQEASARKAEPQH